MDNRLIKSRVLNGLLLAAVVIGTLWAGTTTYDTLKLRDGAIKDANGVTRLTIGSTNAIVGNLTVSGTMVPTGATQVSTMTVTQTLYAQKNVAVTGTLTAPGFTLATSSAPRDSSSAVGIIPTMAGQLCWNSTDLEVCVSTATNRFAWIRVSSTSVTACQH